MLVFPFFLYLDEFIFKLIDKIFLFQVKMIFFNKTLTSIDVFYEKNNIYNSLIVKTILSFTLCKLESHNINMYIVHVYM